MAGVSGGGQALNDGMKFNHQASDSGAKVMDSMMGDLSKTTMDQMKMNTEMGQLNMMSKLNEGLAKIFKAIGESVKGLCG